MHSSGLKMQRCYSQLGFNVDGIQISSFFLKQLVFFTHTFHAVCEFWSEERKSNSGSS